MTAGYWTEAENIAVILLYFAMLGRAKSGVAYSKAAMIRNAQYPTPVYQGPLHARCKCSFELKLMNCSACLLDLVPDAETMHGHGYRELSNYQADLKAAMSKVLAGEL